MTNPAEAIAAVLLSSLRLKLETDAGRCHPPGPGPDPKAEPCHVWVSPLTVSHGRSQVLATAFAFGHELGVSFDWPAAALPTGTAEAVRGLVAQRLPAVLRHDWTHAPYGTAEGLAAARLVAERSIGG